MAIHASEAADILQWARENNSGEEQDLSELNGLIVAPAAIGLTFASVILKCCIDVIRIFSRTDTSCLLWAAEET